MEAVIDIPSFIVLHFTALCKYYVFYGLKVCSNPASKNPSAPLFQQYLLTSCLCVKFW